MMLTVAPVQEKKSVMPLRSDVRPDASHVLNRSSLMPRSLSGPSAIDQPIARTTSHHTVIGRSTRTARSRPASFAEGRDWSSRHLVSIVIDCLLLGGGEIGWAPAHVAGVRREAEAAAEQHSGDHVGQEVRAHEQAVEADENHPQATYDGQHAASGRA